MSEVVRQAKGWRRRQDIIDAAAGLLRDGGPAAVTHRAVASRAGCSLSATTYYFSGLEELLTEAGNLNIATWASRAERVATEVEQGPPMDGIDDSVNVLLRACLPGATSLENHYLQLVAASQSPAVVKSYREGRARLDQAIQRILDAVGRTADPALVIAIVDGSAVAALSEGRDVRETAAGLLRRALINAENRTYTATADV